MYHLTRYHYPRTANLYPAFAARSPLAGLESEIDRLFASALSDFARHLHTLRAAPAAAHQNQTDLWLETAPTGRQRQSRLRHRKLRRQRLRVDQIAQRHGKPQ